MTKDLWTITYAEVGSRGTTITMAYHTASRREAFRKAAALLANDRRRTGGLTLTITKGNQRAL